MLSRTALTEIIFSLAKNLNDAKMGIEVKISALKEEIHKALANNENYGLMEIIFLLIVQISKKDEMIIQEEEIREVLDKAGILIPTDEFYEFEKDIFSIKHTRLIEDTQKKFRES